MITLEDWALIRRLHLGDGVPMAHVAARLGISRNTVARAVAAAGPPVFRRGPVPSVFDGFELDVRALLRATPSMPSTVLAERVGWLGSPSWFRKRVALIRPEYAPTDPADRILYSPGDQAQCDLWFPPVLIPLGDGRAGSPPVLVMVSSFSKTIAGVMIPTRTTPDLLAGMWCLLSTQLRAVPRRLIWDNEAGIGRRNRLAEGVSAFTGVLATRIVQLKPFDPESKGIVERANQYLETSFLPGRVFASPDDFNRQLMLWLPKANMRMVRALKARPVDLFGQDRAAMLSLPPVAPAAQFTAQVRLPRDYYVRVLSNDYSVDPQAIGRMVDIRADLDEIQVLLGSRIVATHTRVWGSGTTVTDPEHVRAAARLRHQFQQPRVSADESVVLRDLGDYDTAFGVSLDDNADGQVA